MKIKSHPALQCFSRQNLSQISFNKQHKNTGTKQTKKKTMVGQRYYIIESGKRSIQR